MSNPAFSDKVFKRVDAVIVDSSPMTVQGTINKTGILLLLVVAGASLGWNAQSGGLLIGALLVSCILSIAIIMGPQRASYLSPVYAVFEGVLLGAISSFYAVQYPGIVSNALILTLSCLFLTLVLFRFKIVQVTDKFRSVIMISTMSICLTYVVDLVMGFFGSGIPMIHQSSALGIGFSLVVVVVAAMNLFLDFDMVEKAQARGAPKFMEWYCGFALLVTLVWLYLEILRLLSKLNKK